MPAKKSAKKHRNPKGRTALFCYVTKSTVNKIKAFQRNAGFKSQGDVVMAALEAMETVAKDVVTHGEMKRPIA